MADRLYMSVFEKMRAQNNKLAQNDKHEKFEKHRRIGIAVAVAVLMVLGLVWIASGAMPRKSASHIIAKSPYNKGDYIYSTVIFTGNGMDKESVVSVKDIEDLAHGENGLAYQTSYSMRYSDSTFTRKSMTGVKLYDLLIYYGLKKDLKADTQVTICSSTGGTYNTTVSKIREMKYDSFKSVNDTKPAQTSIPVILAYGSEGLPLVGPVGSDDITKTFTENDGYIKKANNIGGPLRFMIGQTSYGDNNGDNCIQHVNRIIIGTDTRQSHHKDMESTAEAVRVRYYVDEKIKNSEEKATAYKARLKKTSVFSFEDIENFADDRSDNVIRNYYGSEDFYEGVDIWRFLKKKFNITGTEGKVRFIYSDSSEETLDLQYLRNASGDFSRYITEKGGKTVTGVKPALGYCVNGTPSYGRRLYALLPSYGLQKYDASQKTVKEIRVYIEKSTFIDLNGAEKRLTVKGDGLKHSDSISVRKLENNMGAISVTRAGYRGVSLYRLLEHYGIEIDAKTIVVKNAENKVEIPLSEAKKNADKLLVISRTAKGKALSSKEGPLALRSSENLAGIESIELKTNAGQWNHSKGVYTKYLDQKIKISGTAVKKTRTYMVDEIENLGQSYTVRDTFAAGRGKAGYQGIILMKLIKDNLKDGIKKPGSIFVKGCNGYAVQLTVSDVMKKIESKYQPNEKRYAILAYSKDGAPLVKRKDSEGYVKDNQGGPIKVIIESQTSKWVNSVQEIIINK